jgi:hypothetical protein
MRCQAAERRPFKTAKVIPFPHDDFRFEAYDFQESQISQRYDRDRDLVVILEGILRMDAEALKQKVNCLPTKIEGFNVGDLICDLKAASEGFEGLSKLFECAAARLTVVNAKLV